MIRSSLVRSPFISILSLTAPVWLYIGIHAISDLLVAKPSFLIALHLGVLFWFVFLFLALMFLLALHVQFLFLCVDLRFRCVCVLALCSGLVVFVFAVLRGGRSVAGVCCSLAFLHLRVHHLHFCKVCLCDVRLRVPNLDLACGVAASGVDCNELFPCFEASLLRAHHQDDMVFSVFFGSFALRFVYASACSASATHLYGLEVLWFAFLVCSLGSTFACLRTVRTT